MGSLGGAMANDLFRRLLDSGLSLPGIDTSRAERLVRELVKAGQLQVEEAQQTVAELVERGREGSDRIRDAIAAEVAKQLNNAGLATTRDVDAMKKRLARLESATRAGGSSAVKAPAAKKAASAKKATAAKAPATKAATAKKAPARKASAASRAVPTSTTPAKAASTRAKFEQSGGR